MKKSISFILVMLMVLCMVPGVALAAEKTVSNQTDLNTAITNAVDNDVIIIKTDGTYELPGFSSNKTLTIKADDGVAVTFINIGAKNLKYSNVTFENITFDYYPNVNYTGLQHSGELTYKNCTINGQVFLYGSKEVFNNCTFNQNSADAYNVWTYGAKYVEFNGCTFNCKGKSVLVYNEGACATTLKVTDTKFNASSPVEGKAAIEIDTTLMPDGTNIVIDDNTTDTGFANGSVSGKTLWNDKKDQTDLEVWVAGTQVWPEYVAKIGDKGYASLKAAVDAANTMSGNITIEMIDNEVVSFTGEDLSFIGTSEGVDIYSLINVENNITIDLNGKSITAKTGDKNIILINVQKDGNLTLDDNIGGGSISVTADVNTYALLCCLDTTSKMTINDGNYSLNLGMEGQALIYAREDKSVSINGGNFSMGNTRELKNGSPWIFNAKYQDANRIVVTGGTFNDEINHQFWEYEVEVPKEKALKNNGDGTWTVVDAVAYVDEWCKKYSPSGDTKVIREIGYATLAEAITAADTYTDVGDGIKSSDVDKITLLKDCIVDDTLKITENATIELNGKTIIWEGNDTDPIFTVKEGGLLTVNGAFTPLRTGYTFGGWYTDAAHTSPYDLAKEGKVAGGTSLYAKWSVDESNPSASPEITPTPNPTEKPQVTPKPTEKPASSGIKVEYNGGNSFSTSKSDVPTSVEIDGVPVPFTGNGSSFTVGCIDPNAKWVTVKWNSTTVTVNFTPDVNVVCTEIGIPKTGDMPFWAVIAAFFGF